MTSPRKPASQSDRPRNGDASVPASPQRRRRTCRICDTAISAYNPGPHCWRHSAGLPWRGPSAKPKFE